MQHCCRCGMCFAGQRWLACCMNLTRTSNREYVVALPFHCWEPKNLTHIIVLIGHCYARAGRPLPNDLVSIMRCSMLLHIKNRLCEPQVPQHSAIAGNSPSPKGFACACISGHRCRSGWRCAAEDVRGMHKLYQQLL